ncbi:MAG: glycosyltransferase [Lutibacter sp.]|nr:glycosyltransferase [Lutibacter sp.]
MTTPEKQEQIQIQNTNKPSEILFITSYPPRECGIATYSSDLIKALNNKFSNSFSIKVCALESNGNTYSYPDEVKYTLKTSLAADYERLAYNINKDVSIKTVLIQHEFGFYRLQEQAFHQLLMAISKPIVLVFHTVLPHPDKLLKEKVQNIVAACKSIIVMTDTSSEILMQDYEVTSEKIVVIPHGIHLVSQLNKTILKLKYQLKGKKVLTTFGLLSSGKDIETTLDALPAIIKQFPKTVFLILGKTHPEVVKNEGEKYREMLEQKVVQLSLQNHVRFVNKYLELPELLEYLQLTDIYLFTANDPNQAVSGTFVYAMSCGCPIISTPIPHAKEILTDETGIIFDFHNANQLANAAIKLLNDNHLRKNIGINTLHKIASTVWENSAIAHAKLFEKMDNGHISLQYNIPVINLKHFKKLTTGFGMIQFSKINQPDIDSGYTLDDNARALIVMCQHYELTKNEADLKYIHIYYNFIKYCLQPRGNFLNYVDEQRAFTDQNNKTNLEDSNGRAIWALGYLISMSALLPKESQSLASDAELMIQRVALNIDNIHSTRAMAFAIKGLYYRDKKNKSPQNTALIKKLADRLVQMHHHESNNEWQWFESYLTYANSVLPEALLCAWLVTGEITYQEIAKSSFDFLLSKTFKKNKIKVISNKNWLYTKKDIKTTPIGGEQPIDVAYTILALRKFYQVFNEKTYLLKMEIAFNWFLGSNYLNQIIYNPCTGGCYDGLEEYSVNLNQGAESTVSYLMARLTIEKFMLNKQNNKRKKTHFLKLGMPDHLV